MTDNLDTIAHINDDHVSTTDNSPPLSVAAFWETFPEQATIGNKIERARYLRKRLVVIKGKVKSGKSIFPRYMSAIHAPVGCSQRKIVNYFMTSYNRKADRDQFMEHREYRLKVYELYNKKQVEKCIADIDNDLAGDRHVVLHIDELDYGSSWNGLLSTIWTYVKARPDVCCVLYSATPEEILKSELWMGLPDSQKECITFTPSATYRGDRAFLEAGLVEDAEPAFTVSADGMSATLSPQFKAVLRRLKSNMMSDDPVIRKRYIAGVRLCYDIPGIEAASKKDSRALVVFLKFFAKMLEEDGYAIIYDKHDDSRQLTHHAQAREIAWGNRSAWASFSKPTILLIDQKCTRSTELKIHDFIDSWHEYRPNYTYTVSVQAEQRVNHYVGRDYAEFNRIHVYGSLDTWRLSANVITEEEYLRKDTEIRVTVESGFSSAAFMAAVGIAGITHLEAASAITPSVQCYRIPTPKNIATLQTRLEENKTALHVTSVTVRERNNIAGLAPRVSSTERAPIPVVHTEFFPWPLDEHGAPQPYGDHNATGTLAQTIHAWRQSVLEDGRSFNAFKLDPTRYEHSLTDDELKSNARSQTHTLAPDGRYISFYKLPVKCPAYDNRKLHTVCDYSDIEDKSTGKDTPRQTIVYKDGVLGIYVRIPTADVICEPKVLTSHSSMYHGASETTAAARGGGRGRARGRGRGRGGRCL